MKALNGGIQAYQKVGMSCRVESRLAKKNVE